MGNRGIIFLISHLNHVTPYLNCLENTVQMRGHNVCIYAELTKIIPKYHRILSRALLNVPLISENIVCTHSLHLYFNSCYI